MARLGGADEIVLGKIQFGGKRLPEEGEIVAVGLRLLAFRHCGLLNFLSVLVEAGQEKRLLSETAPGAGDYVRNDLFVRMTQVRLAIHVINRGGNIKSFGHLRASLANEAQVGNHARASNSGENPILRIGTTQLGYRHMLP